MQSAKPYLHIRIGAEVIYIVTRMEQLLITPWSHFGLFRLSLYGKEYILYNTFLTDDSSLALFAYKNPGRSCYCCGMYMINSI